MPTALKVFVWVVTSLVLGSLLALAWVVTTDIP